MKQIILGLVLALVLGVSVSGCRWIAPNATKALTEENQYEEMQGQTKLLEEQNKQLKRIADSLEIMAKQ